MTLKLNEQERDFIKEILQWSLDENMSQTHEAVVRGVILKLEDL